MKFVYILCCKLTFHLEPKSAGLLLLKSQCKSLPALIEDNHSDKNYVYLPCHYSVPPSHSWLHSVK